MSLIKKEDALTYIISQATGLADVEKLILEKTSSEAPILSDISKYLLLLGGKRIRPILTLLSAKACGATLPPEKSLTYISAGIELIHMATLLHDDIIDRSPKRRSKEAPWLKYGINDTLICGDFLLSRAFHLCAHLPPYIIEETHTACIELTEGEVTEIPLTKKETTESEYIEIARKKTASLFRLASLSGSFCANAPKEVVTLFGKFGESLGIAFQILDDILDVTGDEALLGKKPGVDLKEKKPSYINILTLSAKDPGMSDVAAKLTSEDEITDADLIKFLPILKESKIVEQARATATSYAEKARSYLVEAKKQFQPKTLETKYLEGIIDFTIDRLR